MITSISTQKNILIYERFEKGQDLSGGNSPVAAAKIAEMKENRVGSVFIVSSDPVDSDSYIGIVNAYHDSGFRVYNYHFDALDGGDFNSFVNCLDEIRSAVSAGAVLLLSYGRSHAGVLLACYQIRGGRSLDAAMRAVKDAGIDAAEVVEHQGFIRAFQERVKPVVEPAAVKDDAAPAEKQAEIPGANAPTVTTAAPPAGKQADSVPAAVLPTGEPAGKQADSVPAAVLPAGDTAGKQADKAGKTAGKAADKADAAPSKKAAQPEKAKPAEGKSKKAAAPVPVPASQEAARDVKKPPFFLSIRFKLISIIFLIIIISMSGMIYLATYFFKRDNKIRVQENNHNLSQIISLKVKSEIEKYSIIAVNILQETKKDRVLDDEGSTLEGTRDLLFGGIMKYSPRGKRPEYVKTFSNGRLMARYQMTKGDLDQIKGSTEQAVGKAFAGETTVVNLSPFTEKPIMAVLSPLEKNPGGEVNSILVTFIRLETLLKTFRPDVTGITRAVLVNDRGDIIAHPDENAVLSGGNLSGLPIVKRMMTSKVDNEQTSFKDEKGRVLLGSFKKIGLGGCAVIATVEENLAYQEVYRIQRRNIYLMAIVLSSAMIILFLFGKTITTPIFRLVEATKKIMMGQYSVDIKPSSRDEVGQLTSTFVEMGRGLEEKEKIKSAFGKFVNKEIAEAAIRDEIRLGGERKNVAILFSDIRNFTAISEKLEPEEVVEFLNQYMTLMVRCVEQANGIVDKFIGDAIMAVWGTPISHGNDTENAINGALAMRKALVEFNRDRGGDKKPVIKIGVGINMGVSLAGQIGSEERMEYTVIGDPVNLASRIETLNKPFGTDILISQDAYQATGEAFDVVPMKQIKVKGKSGPQQVYAVLGRKDDPEHPRSLEEMRALTGIEYTPEQAAAADRAAEEGEVKYEIIN